MREAVRCALRGAAGAATLWKALLAALLLNGFLAVALVRPVSNALHGLLDKSPWSARLAGAAPDPIFFRHLQRNRPDVLGDPAPLVGIATGEPVKGEALRTGGATGSLVALGVLNALLASVLAGGAAGRLAAAKERGRLSAFGADCGRFAFSSLVLGAVSLAAIGALWRWGYVPSAALLRPDDLRYEWEAVAFGTARLLALLVAAGFVRLVVLYARASMGVSRNGNPFRALVSGGAAVAGRPLTALALEVGFSAAALLPLAAWGVWGPVWNGAGPVAFAVALVGQQVVVVWRLAARAAHLGAAIALVEAGSPSRSGRDPAPVGDPA